MSLSGQLNLSLWPILAQANPTDVDVTPGAMVSASLILLAMVGSIAMLIVWWVRFQQFGYFLPAAQRGVLRIPAPLMAITLALAGMIAGLVALMGFASVPDGDQGLATSAPAAVSNADLQDSADTTAGGSVDAESSRPTGNSAVDNQTAVAANETSAGIRQSPDDGNEPDDPDDEEAAVGSTVAPGLSSDGSDVSEVTASAAAQITPEQMMSNMVQMLVFDIGLVAVLGIFVFVASSGGRVWLPGAVPIAMAGGASNSSVAHARSVAPGRLPDVIVDNPWPDLDEPIETRSTSGGWTPSKGTAGQVDLTSDESRVSDHDDPGQHHTDLETATGESSAHGDGAIGGSALPAGDKLDGGQAKTAFAELNGEGHSAALHAGSTQDVQPPVEEQFSPMTEVRFAIEVFLAAFVPTLVFRLVILGLVVAITGKQPESHPFLEMMDDGVGLPILVMIAFTAIILAPVMEELMYRVIILGGMAQLGRPVPGLIISSVIFCFAHQFPDSLALLPLAFALGYTYLRRRSYITVILVHLLFNAFNMLLAGMAMAVFGYALW